MEPVVLHGILNQYDNQVEVVLRVAGFEVLTAVFMKLPASVLWGIGHCTPLQVNRRFGRPCANLQGWRVSQSRIKHETRRKVYSSTLKMEGHVHTKPADRTLYAVCYFVDRSLEQLWILLMWIEMLSSSLWIIIIIIINIVIVILLLQSYFLIYYIY